MLRIVLLSLVLTQGLCGIAPTKHLPIGEGFVSKIIQGEEARDNEFPYMASLNWNCCGHACGASIVSPNWVLTAAHCCLTGLDMHVYVGSNNNHENGQRYEISQYIVNGDYDPDQNWRNDVCLVRTQNPIQMSDRVQQVKLPPQDWPVNDGDRLTVSGWGYTTPDAPQTIPDKLMVGRNFEALSNERCGSETGVDMHPSYLCAHGSHAGQGVCQGDSGSPIVKDGVQVGVTSWVFLPCGSGWPDFYSRVPYAIPWINQVLQSEAKTLKFAN